MIVVEMFDIRQRNFDGEGTSNIERGPDQPVSRLSRTGAGRCRSSCGLELWTLFTRWINLCRGCAIWPELMQGLTLITNKFCLQLQLLLGNTRHSKIGICLGISLLF